MSVRPLLYRAFGGTIAAGCLAVFLCLISAQIYFWFRDGEWTHIGISDGLRIALERCCVRDGDTGSFAALVHWIDAPTEWLGLHKVLEVIPASLALFALSVLGNCWFIYGNERIEEQEPAEAP